MAMFLLGFLKLVSLYERFVAPGVTLWKSHTPLAEGLLLSKTNIPLPYWRG